MIRPDPKTSAAPPRTTCLKIAALAECDPRSVRKYFASPERAHPLTIAAIRRALPALGMSDPHPELAL